MSRSWMGFRQSVKSRWSALAGGLWRSRESSPPRLPEDRPVGLHGFGARRISLCVNVAQKVGLRAAEAVLRIVFEWLGLDEKIPDWTTIRMWMQRVGVAVLEEPADEADDWIWMADHSNQIGAEKALVVLGVRVSQLPPPGRPLSHEDVRVLAVEPDTTWKRDDMARAYDELAEKFGAPRAVLVDGAPALRDGADVLKSRRDDTLVLGDFKHKAANVLKSVVGGDERFAPFQTRVGQTRVEIQQTELAHLVPPNKRPKARFMNLAPTLHWATMMLWLLEHPEAKARAGIAAERLESKLGWLREYAADVTAWHACQRVVSQGVTFVNEHGLSPGTAQRFREWGASELSGAASRDVADRLTTFLTESESGLRPNERLPLNTEILESAFGLYKQQERQHSQGGFTSLLASFGTLLRPTTPQNIRHAFAKVSVKDLKTWLKTHLTTTPTAKRQSLYREFQSKTRATHSNPTN